MAQIVDKKHIAAVLTPAARRHERDLAGELAAADPATLQRGYEFL
jgi:hypothetical protein